MAPNANQYFLLADHVKLSLLERQRAVSLKLPATAQDGQISGSLESLREGIASLRTEQQRLAAVEEETSAALTLEETIHTLQAQYDELASQFASSRTPLSPVVTTPNDPALADDFARATERPLPATKAVRFSDGHDAEHEANRSALFPYRDIPALNEASAGGDSQGELSNEQIHAYHSSVLREQDEALDRLGQSIGRQRELSMQIGNELDEQVLMLDEVDGLVDRQQGRLDGARRGLRGVADRASENWGGVTIAVLVVVLLLVVLITR